MSTPEQLALRQSLSVCLTHRDALREALADIRQRTFDAVALQKLSKTDRRLLDQFAYRYTRLQDDLGARLMPAALRALGEDVATMSALDRFDRLEQIGWLPSAEEWTELRRIRNEFAHEYPETAEERHQRFQAAIRAAEKLLVILQGFQNRIEQRFPE